MIIVHHLEHSRSQRILWLLEELELPYEIEHYKRDPRTSLAPESLRRVHRLGKAPVISDGSVVMAESGAILEYLVERYGDGRLKPATDTPQWLDYIYWMHFAEGSLMPLLVMKLVFGRVATSPMPFFAKPIARKISGKMNDQFLQPRIQDQLALVEEHLSRHPWFAGEQMSAADVQMSFPLQAAASRANLDNLPHIRDFIQKVEALPAYQRAIERGGPLQLLGG
ncbi:glutathione S-transferase [Alloalcanivorax gelatiniphagus]|uniref:Glutathione S-transferase n=1 Tax=Alloalcanivorax gelatiniphagus TaxID=1194167 RepID=A0ABY2XL07_9GAMM|nr:glutathione S-transferase [Alloalcanivorax gelatiniphagus]TMW12207.1 glutathione S-transferase [Alloalcanivorax gelatiniphagus]